MAILTALPNGQLWQFAPSSLNGYPLDPTATTVLNFDDASNSALIADIQTNFSSYTMPLAGGAPQLQKNGQPVAVASAISPYSLQSAILTGYPDATIKAAVVALWNGTATLAQTQKALAYCVLKLHQAGTI